MVSDDLYARSARVAADYGTALTTHALETRSELMWNVEHVGTSAMRRLGVITGDVVPGWMVCLVEPSERDCGC